MNRSSAAILAQVAIWLNWLFVCFHFDHRIRLFLLPYLWFLSWTQRFSQQTTQQTSFLPNRSQYTPADVLVPDFTTDAQPSPVSNTGSLCSGSADIAMCPPVSHVAGDGTPGTGVPPALEAIQREQFAVLLNSIASMQTKMQKQISELIAITTPASTVH